MEEIIQKIIWYNKQDFDMDDPVCDFCDGPITEFPCAIKGSHALCRKCQFKVGVKAGDTEYFETMAFNLGMEDKQAGVNCGGR